MAPIKFDEQIKGKLEERTLQPSSKAWDRLSERLETEEKKPRKNVYWWYGAAASIIGVLFLVSQLSNSRTDEAIQPQVVESSETIEDVEVKKADVNTEINNKSEVIVSTKKENKKPRIEKEIPKYKVELLENKAPILVANTVEKDQQVETIVEQVEIIKEKLTFEDQKVHEIVAQVQELKENKSEVTDADIEALLQQAQREITLKKLYNESTGIVDANALLQDVEEDLDRSFRTKVFEALKVSYGTVKSAVATRND